MNIEDRQFLTEWGGEKWVVPRSPKEYYRTFDNPDDCQWLVDKVKEKRCSLELYEYADERMIDLHDWWIMPPSQQCQLICDFLRERGKTA